MISPDEMPEDNPDLASLEVHFPRLPDDSPSSCPVPLDDLVNYLRLEGEDVDAQHLEFVRTAAVEDVNYWLWRFGAADGLKCYATVSRGPEGTTLGYGQDWYALTPEQFLLGDFHQAF